MINQFHNRRIIMVYNFTVSEIFVKQNIKKAFNPCFNPSEFIIQSVVLPLIFCHFCENILFLPPSLRIFPGNAIIAKVESAKSEAFASCSGKKDHPPDKKRGDMSILLDIRKELFYAL